MFFGGSPADAVVTNKLSGRKLRMILMLFITGLLVHLSDTYMGPAMGGLAALLVTLSFPAIIINYAVSDNMFESLNPVNIIRLVNSIGLPYGLILGFILIMSGSIAVLYQLVLWVLILSFCML